MHGGIDGFSRLCVYLACATNNRANTVKTSFLTATAEFGWPSRVRSDRGTENVEVARQTIAHRGTGRGSHITGSSVHNQRIERLWRDYFRCIGVLFYNLFYFMEDSEILNSENDNHLFSLHFIYIPLINQALQLFKRSWNNHKLSTEGNFTPHQLYIKGMLERFGTNDPATRDVFDDDSIEETEYGVDLDGPTPENRSSNDVQVREVTFPISAEQQSRLQEIVQSLQPCPNHGISLFLAAKTEFCKRECLIQKSLSYWYRVKYRLDQLTLGQFDCRTIFWTLFLIENKHLESTMAQEGHSPVLIFHSPVLIFTVQF